MTRQRAARAFTIATLISIVLPFLPILRYVLLPFDYLNTHLHELCHAVVCCLTGGKVDHIMVYMNGEGVTFTWGGLDPAIQMAGYLGSSLIGAAMIASMNTQKKARIWLCVLGTAVLGSSIIWVRGDAVGWPLGLVLPFLIYFFAFRLKGDNLLLAAQFVALQQSLNSVRSLRDLILLSSSGRETDAHHLAQSTHVPEIIWALLWTGVGVFGLVMAVIRTYRRIPVQAQVAASET